MDAPEGENGRFRILGICSPLRNEVGKYFELKEKSIGPPEIYLGGRMREVTLENSVKAWSFGSSQYCRAAVANVQSYLQERGWKLPKKAETPIQTSYRPELDISEELSFTDGAYYQSLIGILRWMVELGRVDICLEVSMLSSHMAMPRQGHLDQVFHMFAYLKKYHNSCLVFDPTEPDLDMRNSTQYAKAQRSLSDNVVESRCRSCGRHYQ